MDTTAYSEGQFITPEFVKFSPTKIGVLLGEATPEETKYGKQLTVNVEIDRKIKVWNLNRDSVKNMQQLGIDSSAWVAKRVRFNVVSVGGKDRVIGNPIDLPLNG
jgi:hypothetical protein